MPGLRRRLTLPRPAEGLVLQAESGAAVAGKHQEALGPASFVNFPPMQTPASFNLEAVKAQILAAIKAKQG